MSITSLGCFLLFAASISVYRANAVEVDPDLYQQEKLRTNAGAVSIMVSGINSTSSAFAEDIRNVVNDLRPGGQRALISYGEGGPHNLKDVIFLLGVHMTIVDENNLKLVRESSPVYADIDEKIRYVTKLYNAEFHILAREEIKSVTGLEGKKVNVELINSQTALVAEKIFGSLGINYTATNYDDALAQKKLLSGEIDAMVISDGAPRESLLELKKSDGIHFLALDQANLPDHDLSPILSQYLPAELSSDYYPNLIEAGKTVPTVASRMVLAIYNWPEDGERYNRNRQYISEFFSKIEEFRHPARHPKWREVNIAANVPGWKRFKPAQEWLDRNLKTTGDDAGAASRRKAFDTFLTQRQDGIGDRELSPAEREALFTEFQKFINQRAQ